MDTPEARRRRFLIIALGATLCLICVSLPAQALGDQISTPPAAKCTLGSSAYGLTGTYSTDGHVSFARRPLQEWEFMATGTGVSGVTVNFPAEMVLQLNHSASLDELGKVRALGRLHVDLDGSPFTNSTAFRMDTDLRRSVIKAEATTDSGSVRVEIRAHVPLDAFRIDIYDRRKTPGAVIIRFEQDAPSGKPSLSGNRALFFHENPTNGAAINTSNRHWLAGRTFGLCVESAARDGVGLADGQMVVPASNHQTLYIVGASDRNGKDAFLKSVDGRMRKLAAMGSDAFIRSHEAWWRQFWSRSCLEPDDPKGRLTKFRAAFDLFRYYTACCTSDRRETPARFQIELYRYHLRQHVWLAAGICAVEMYQSVFGTMRTGDWETVRSEFRFFQESLPFYMDQAQRIQGVRGAYIGMGHLPWTTQAPYEISPTAYGQGRVKKDVPFNGDNPAGPLFMLSLGCDYADLSGDRQFAENTLRPLATEVLEYFRLRYPRGEDGKLAFDPCNAGETWQAVRNPSEVVCAFRFLLPRLISVGQKRNWPNSLIDRWREMLAAAPDIPRGRLQFDPRTPDVKPVILPGNLLVPAQDMSGCKAYSLGGGKAQFSINRQQTELFSVWPARLMLRTPEDRRMAVESFQQRLWKHVQNGWNLDSVHAAALGLLDEVMAHFDKYFDATYVFPCGLAKEESPANPKARGIPEYPSLQGMGTGVIPVLEMLLQDYPDQLVILPCWDPAVAVKFTLYSPYAGKVTVNYDPTHGAIVHSERSIPVVLGPGIQPAKQ